MDRFGYPAASPCPPHLRRGRHVGAESQDCEIFQGKKELKKGNGHLIRRFWEIVSFFFCVWFFLLFKYFIDLGFHSVVYVWGECIQNMTL